MMQALFQWLGLATAWAIIALCAVWSFGWVVELITRLHAHMVAAAQRNARQRLGQEIAGQAHWFSESKETQAALYVIGRNLMEHPDYYYDAANIREKWRKKLGEK